MENNIKNWVSIDIGAFAIKASVMDKKSECPVRLCYKGMWDSSLLSSDVYVSDAGDVVLGDDALLQGILNPANRVLSWGVNPTISDECYGKIASCCFAMIKKAAVNHYGDSAEVGAVILYEGRRTEIVKDAAASVFAKVEMMKPVDALKELHPREHLLIADFGESAFRISFMGKEYINESLGFSELDLLSLIDFSDAETHNCIQRSLEMEMVSRMKISLNSGEYPVLPHGAVVKGGELSGSFGNLLRTWMFRCFEECRSWLTSLSDEERNAIEVIVFTGGGAVNAVIEDVHQTSNVRDFKSYNSTHKGFDPRYAASFAAVQVMTKKENVTIMF